MAQQPSRHTPICFRGMFVTMGALVLLLAQASAAAADPFMVRLNELRSRDAAKVGRETIIAEYQKLIDDYPNEPRITDAMRDIGGRLENANPATGMKAEPAEAIAWFRKAAAAAAPGSKMWSEARQLVARRVSQNGPEGVAEARKLLEIVSQAAPGDTCDQAMLEHDWMSQCAYENNLPEAERHCLNLLNWYQDPQRIPKESLQKSSLDSLISAAGFEMVINWSNAPIAKAERRSHIQELAAKYPKVAGVAAAVDHALQHVEQSSEPSPVVAGGAPVPAVAAAGQTPPARSAARPQPYSFAAVIAIVSVLGGVGLIIAAFLIRAKRSRADT